MNTDDLELLFDAFASFFVGATVAISALSFWAATFATVYGIRS